MINQKKSPIVDAEIEEYLADRDLNLTATLDSKAAYEKSEINTDPNGNICTAGADMYGG